MLLGSRWRAGAAASLKNDVPIERDGLMYDSRQAMGEGMFMVGGDGTLGGTFLVDFSVFRNVPVDRSRL